jgi:hypothetical protein
MTQTPRTDAECGEPNEPGWPAVYISADFARQLEREHAELLEALESMVAANGGIAVMPTIEARNQNAALMKAKAAIAKVKGKP